LLSPALDYWTLDLDSASARSANQVVVVSAAAASVRRLAVVRTQNVNFTRVCKRLQSAVNRCQTDGFPTMPK